MKTTVAPTRMFARLPLLLCALALALAGCSQESSTTDPQTDPPSGDVIEALVHGPVESAFFEPLKDSLELTTYDGSQNHRDFDLLIFDGDAHSHTSLKNDGLVQRSLRSGLQVLALDVTEAHKKEVLGSVLHASSCGDSPAYAARMMQDANGRPLVQVLEPRNGKTTYLGEGEVPDTSPTPPPESCEEPALAASAVPEAAVSAANAFADALVKRVSEKGVETLQASALSNIPGDLLYVTYQFTKLITWTVDHTNGAPLGKPQTASIQTNFTFTVFLNNKNNPQGDFQYILADVDATGNPTNGTGYFLADHYHPSTNWTCCLDSEFGWFQDRLQVQVKAEQQDWATISTSPENVNDETEVKTGVEFSIGFKGKEPEADFTYSNETTRNIKDWKVTNKSSGLNTWWDYRTAFPVDADASYECGPDQYIYRQGCYINGDPNDLSMNNMQLHTQTLYRTPSVVDGSATIFTWSLHRLTDLYCYNNGGLWCYEARGDTASNSNPQSYTINLGAVIPIPIASLTFSPNPVKGGASVSGIVTLSKPALMDTPINLSSNSQNATVLPKVIVKQGQTSATFQILTNANGIASGGQTVATISAFYADDFQAQLTVTN